MTVIEKPPLVIVRKYPNPLLALDPIQPTASPRSFGLLRLCFPPSTSSTSSASRFLLPLPPASSLPPPASRRLCYPPSLQPPFALSQKTHCHLFAHIYHTSYAVTLLHGIKGFVDVRQHFSMRDEFIHLQFSGQVIVDQVGKLRATFDTAEGTPFPYAARDELKGCC